MVQRFAAYRIHQSLVESPLEIERFWPLEEVKPKDNLVIEEDMWEKIKKAHNLKMK